MKVMSPLNTGAFIRNSNGYLSAYLDPAHSCLTMTNHRCHKIMHTTSYMCFADVSVGQKYWPAE